MILLTDEEIPYKPDNEPSELWLDIGARDKFIYLEGAKTQLKKVAEESETDFIFIKELVANGENDRAVAYMVKCWQALLEEVK